jgi:hypothetical protein
MCTADNPACAIVAWSKQFIDCSWRRPHLSNQSGEPPLMKVLGLAPVHRLKAREKAAGSEKPTR